MIHLKKPLLSTLSLIFSISLIISLFAAPAASADSSTGVGLSAHALNAYYENWSYVYGGSSYGAVDCSGLISTYNGVGGSRSDMLGSSSESGYVYNGIPNIHGLGLHQPGHVGVYVGGGMAVDARSEYYGVCYQSVYTKSWTSWFKISGVSYPSNGWVKLSGESYYYEDGQYIASTSRTIDGVTYNFDSAGRADSAPDSSAYLATDYSYSSVSSGSSSSNDSYDNSNDYSYSSSEDEDEDEPVQDLSDKYSTLYSGSIGKSVEKLQERLKNLGYFNDDVTQFYGALTEAAVTSFQESAELSITGVADNTTQEALFADTAPQMEVKSLTVGDYSDEILSIQQKLIDLGYFYDDATGYYGEVTAIAVSQFQSANGIGSTGIVDSITNDILFSNEALANPNKGTISYGMQGDSVKAVQQRLIDLRYLTGSPNSTFDDATLEAVHAYQNAMGMEQSNDLTSDDISALYATAAPKSPDFDKLQLGYIGDDVRDLQICLSSLNYFDGILSGYFCEATKQAVIDAQAAMDYEQNGIADADFRTALSLELQKKSADTTTAVSIVTASMATNALAQATTVLPEIVTKSDNSGYLSCLIVCAIITVLLMATVILYNTLLKKSEFQVKAVATVEKFISSKSKKPKVKSARPVKIKRIYK